LGTLFSSSPPFSSLPFPLCLALPATVRLVTGHPAVFRGPAFPPPSFYPCTFPPSFPRFPPIPFVRLYYPPLSSGGAFSYAAVTPPSQFPFLVQDQGFPQRSPSRFILMNRALRDIRRDHLFLPPQPFFSVRFPPSYQLSSTHGVFLFPLPISPVHFTVFRFRLFRFSPRTLQNARPRWNHFDVNLSVLRSTFPSS